MGREPEHGLWSPAPLPGLGPQPRLLRASDSSFGKRGDDNPHPLLLVGGWGAYEALRTVLGTEQTLDKQQLCAIRLTSLSSSLTWHDTA